MAQYWNEVHELRCLRSLLKFASFRGVLWQVVDLVLSLRASVDLKLGLAVPGYRFVDECHSEVVDHFRVLFHFWRQSRAFDFLDLGIRASQQWQ